MADKPKTVQIPEELFILLCRVYLLDETGHDLDIQKGLQAKLDAITRRLDYETYKTATSQEEREEARRRYLDRVGISEEWRW